MTAGPAHKSNGGYPHPLPVILCVSSTSGKQTASTAAEYAAIASPSMLTVLMSTRGTANSIVQEL